MLDPLLSKYSVIMVRRPSRFCRAIEEDERELQLNDMRSLPSQIDEAHERGMYTDLLLGVLKKCVVSCLSFLL